MPERARSRRIRTAVVATAVVLGAVLVACSSSDDTSTTATPSTPVAPAGSSAPGAAPDDGTVAGTTPSATLTLTSGAFDDGGSIPVRHACVNQGGENASPPLSWSGVPSATATLVLVVHDPDAPLPGGFTHLVTTIAPEQTSVDDGASLTGDGPMARWIGPCPPSGEHRYVFTLYAFGPETPVAPDTDKATVDSIAGEALATATLTGLFAHQG